ncbi:MGH1-like glycoside hydrolase domain-containing protein [Luteolibacter marinus]|uniref:MGH1-like glycoside hydrolase domain-containing protein n=1 Tax=Luteolibacter marinus TaxID=2776705 RepID=UPI0018692C16|nr:hypothetical protein [Luteolibacter marinus]
MMTRALLSFLLLTLPAVARHPVGNVNRFLSNSSRTDLIGRDLWTTGKEVNDERVSKPDLSGRPQVPEQNWTPPALGMNGVFAAGHQTPLADVIRIKVRQHVGGEVVPLDLVVTRHQWTPAWSITHYRPLPSGKPGSYPFSGTIAIKETKCVTGDDVFVTRLEILNDSRGDTTVDLLLETPEFTRSDDGKVRFDAETNVGGISGGAPGKRGGWPINPTGFLSTSGDLAFGEGIVLPPQKTKTLRLAFAVDETGTTNAADRVAATLADPDPFKRHEQDFNAWFDAKVPAFTTDDPDLAKLYYYRWFLVKRNIHDPKRFIANHPYKRPAIYESPIGDWFCAVIGLPIPVQVQEVRWCRDITPGKDHILNWAENVHYQYRDYLQFTPAALWNFYKINPDPEIRAAVAQPATDYAWKDVPVHGQPQLPVQEGSWPTGAEYQPNFYQFTKPEPWDWRHDVEGHKQGLPYAKSVRLDKAAFTIANLYGAAHFMEELGNTRSFTDSRAQADRMLETVKQKHWKDGFFYSADPETGALADQAAGYDGFLPFLFGMIRDPQYFTAFDRFFDPDWFWSEYPITTVAKNSPMYWSGNCLTGPTAASVAEPHVYHCCWNGPMWNYNNSAMCNALGSVAATPGGAKYRDGWLEFYRRWSDSHFIYGDRSVPCALEHLRPTDGANFRRQVVDYFHSAWLDPLYSFWAGISVPDSRDRVRFDPFTDEDFRLENVPAGGRELTFVQQDGRRSVLDADGKLLAEGAGALEVK